MSAWKPGDVAIVDWTTSRGERRLETMMRTRNSTWVGGDDIYATDNKVRSVRLLAVIDPESEYEVSQLTRRFVNALGNDTYSVGIQDEAMQAALCSLLAPPRIDEPGTWGVVEASCVHSDERRKWIKHDDGNWWPAEKYSHVERQVASGRDPRLPDDWDSLVDPALVREGVAE